MSDITLKQETANQNLGEYEVGKAGVSCLFPGIRQCFAIAGRRQSSMVCTHVSPGATPQQMSDTFAFLREIGGNWVTSWHVIGPFVDHFNTSNALWKSVQDIRGTFKSEFGETGANHWILDISKQRHTPVLEEGFTIKTEFGKVDVKADLDTAANKIRFYYKGDRGANLGWNRLYNKKFSRF
ncbi:hypothetical protein [Meridianimarinicoccus aquatilis]|uniref:Uncharacterized protein n=1 Tax=Meridianimarinicoccus aquatilis TaxID=2552766 RepID=A0A4R6ALQ0_9RHOB|nr:hypothetical protein [Fluviibacterium aquatile]TDL84355.1 hypothetical protein E2L05_18590 [Fluviibacterium aquatile]